MTDLAKNIFTELHNISNSFNHIPQESITNYIKSLKKHTDYVYQAGKILKVPIDQLSIHDLSKLSSEEFEGYVMHFQGGGSPKLFAKSWLHHIHNNPHHWQYWMFADGFSLEGSNIVNGVLPMPENYVREMVADWMGSSKAYTDSWDMTDWLKNNLLKIIPNLHPETKEILKTILDDMGYNNVI